MPDTGVVVVNGELRITRDCFAFRFWFPIEHPIGLPDGYEHQVFDEPTHAEQIHLSAAGHPSDALWLVGSLCCRQVDIIRNWFNFRNADAAFRAYDQSMPNSAVRTDAEPDAAFGEEVTVTVIEVVTYGWDLDAASAAFDRSLDILQRFERQVRLATKRPVPQTTRELLPSLIPSMAHPADASPQEWDTRARAFFPNANIQATISPVMLGEPELQRLGRFDDRDKPGLTAAESIDLLLEAQLELHQRGNYRAAVLAAATAAESMLDTLLAALVWEEGKSPRQAASILGGDKFLKRIRRELPGRLGGSWDFETPGPIRDWERDCHRLRHRVIHRGQRPDSAQANAAVGSAEALTLFLTDRLIDSADRYPRVAGTWADRDRFSRRAAQQVRALAAAEPSWVAMFEGWYASAVSMARPELATPTLEGAIPTVVVTAANPLQGYFVAVHEDSGLAAAVEAPEITVAAFDALRSAALKRVDALPMFGAIVGLEGLVRIGDWVPVHEIVPNTNPIHPTRVFNLRHPPQPAVISSQR